MIFNPPYVVTPPEEMEGHGISVSWAGGKDGRVVIDRFMPQVPDVLAPGGRLYLVCIKENFPDQLLAQGEKMGLVSKMVKKQQMGIELLFVLSFTKPAPANP